VTWARIEPASNRSDGFLVDFENSALYARPNCEMIRSYPGQTKDPVMIPKSQQLSVARKSCVVKCSVMKSGKDLRDSKGRSIESTSPKEVMAVMFVMVEAASGAFRLRLVSNDDLIRDLKAQGAMEGFLADGSTLCRIS
jgi:hypothetical protein